MKGYGALAGRYLKQQRKRSILTVIGIILSVALISAIGTMGMSIKDNLLKEAVYNSGSYHFAYSKADSGLYNEITKNVLVDRTGVMKESTETELRDSIKLTLNEVNADLFQLAPLHLASGQWPKSSGEIIVEEWILPYLPGEPKLGGTTTLSGPDGQPHEYIVSGLLINTRINQLNLESSAFSLNGEVGSSSGELDLFATLKPGVDISDNLDSFRELAREQFSPNNLVLAYMGESPDDNFNQVLLVIFGTLIGLVVLSTAAVIYNIFHISVLERIRQFGLLRTLGATPSQIRGLVFREATTLAAIGIPLGLLCGWGVLWLIITLMVEAGFRILSLEQFELNWHTWIMAGSVVIGLLSVYLAAWLPARKAASVSPVEAVRGAGSIVRESYRRFRIPSPLQAIGVGGNMAAKNIRRNRSKFRITSFSVIISVTLFIVFHYFTQEMFSLTSGSNDEERIAFSVTISSQGNTEGEKADFLSEEQIGKLENLPGVRGVYGRYNTFGTTAWVPRKLVNEQFLNISRIQYTESTKDETDYSLVNMEMAKYDDSRLREAAAYLTDGTADPEKLKAMNGVLLVQTVKPMDPDTGKKTILDMTRYKVGDKLLLDMSSGISGSEGDADKALFREVTIGGILSQSPFGMIYTDNYARVMAPADLYDDLVLSDKAASPADLARYGIDVAMEDGADDGPVREALQQLVDSTPGAYLVDTAADQKEQRQFTLQMQIFIYGFLTVIGLIGSLNIINTVQTNLLLRRREFGLLQAVGMTMGQLKRMATLEGVWFGLLGAFWGLVLGIGFCYFLYLQLTELQGMPFQFPWDGSLIACAAAFVVGLFSVQGPLRRLAKTNLIDSLREEN
ncbi:ABC transporter permease [Cohnella thailandensis]|uniref:ABC transporter permease n=1 Tax=Cohnella thailandensis TaxID=557557 RepID=A0A841STK4_9BACL|nr:ABC transporter permease [Cohnella thailandensis]MBB6633240.1 ABC transporter permease [Cohnella thailandensis]MBP1975062.1 putative ABC transport system permease protein [Cohnella thailandensis]